VVQRIFLFKLAKPDHRKQLIIDSGFRCHLTEYSRTTATAPSSFVSRLRKYLKTRRITAVNQLGTDRIIDIVFSDGLFHVFLEFFAGGNIILTDGDYRILALFRTVAATAGEQYEVKVGIQYSVEKAQHYSGVSPVSEERLRKTLQKAIEAEKPSADGGPKKSKKKVDVFRKAVANGFPEFPPLLLEDAFAATGFDSSVSLKQVLEDQDLFRKAMDVLHEAESVIAELSKEDTKNGFIVAKEQPPKKGSELEQSEENPLVNLLFDDFHPFRPRQFDGKPGYRIIEHDNFNKTVDEYFSSIESQKLESRLTEHEETARRKLDAARADHRNRAGALKQAQELHIRKAEAIQANIYRVQEATDAVNGLIAQGMDWVEIERLIEMEQGRNNPVAQTIKLPLKLQENTITVVLNEETTEIDEEEDEFSESEPEESDGSDSEIDNTPQRKATETLTVDIDLSLSPWSNATQYYDQKRVAEVKEQKTIQSSEKALKSQEKKVTEDLKRNLKQEKQVLRPSRKPFWFEKYLFFISSDGYLVLGGRDSHQVEILYRRYLKKGDVFVHADLDGATPMIVKNKENTPDAPIPPGTLTQAGGISVATSKAWESKALMPAWWVQAHQVSKTNERGELLASGGFAIKGEKNFLAPGQPVLGFAVLFQISKESIQHHRKHRLEEPESEAVDIAVDTTQEVSSAKKVTVSEEANTMTEDAAEKEVDEEESSSDSEKDAEETAGKSNPLQSAAEPDSDSDDADVNDEETPPTITKPPQSNRPTPTPTPKQPTRGKKGKAKKAAQKYAHQDEEDRELALRLLGANSKAHQAAETAAAEAKAKHEAELEAQKRRRRAQHERAAEAERKRQEQFFKNAGADGNADDEAYDEETIKGEAEDLAWLPALVGTPLPEDEVLAALPVAAPWSAVARFKYRAKLQAGAVKKGKAIKDILGHWIIEAGGAPGGGTGNSNTAKISKKIIADDVAEGLDRATAERMRAREADLLKGWRDVEVMNTLPVGKVRIVSGGGGSTGGKGGGGGKGDKGKGGAPKGGKGGKKK
jgi:predicted ribosome quality control (RQC) complex YloA/Tae2 family protein